jgi:uncharacterized protein (TIGR02270 family)
VAVGSTIISVHAEDAAIHWLRRDHAVGQPHYNLADLAKLDGQVEAHLDGLRIAGDTGWRTCVDELRWRESGEVFMAAVLALEEGNDEKIECALQVLGYSYHLQRSFVSACGWIAESRISRPLRDFWNSGDAQRRYLALAACAIHRTNCSSMLRPAIEDDDTQLRARALRAAGESGRTDLIDNTRDAMDGVDERSRIAAAWATARLVRDERAVSLLRTIVEHEPETSYRELQLTIGRLDLDKAQDWISSLASVPESHRSAVVASGFLGSIELVPWLIERMHEPQLARVAGESFSMITGVDIAYQDLDAESPEGFEAGPNDDPADENVEMDPDENLPWPNRAAIADWWVKHRDEFKPGVRYLLGRPIDDEPWLEHVLRHAYQRQRAAAALELAIRHPTEPLFNVAAPAWRQKKLLGLK